mgnify:CR=1 FL=1
MRPRILLLVVFFTAGSFLISAQNISRKVVSFGGKNNMEGGYYLSWTSGEPVTQTINGGGYYLTQGFQQPSLIDISLPHSVPVKDSINVYPNPLIGDNLTISFSVKEVMKYYIEVISLDGRKLLIREIEFPDMLFHEEIIDFSAYLKGLYMVHIYSPDRKVNSTYKIEKVRR